MLADYHQRDIVRDIYTACPSRKLGVLCMPTNLVSRQLELLHSTLLDALLQHSCFQQQLSILTVCPSHLFIHRCSFCLSKTLVETALQTEFGHALVSLDHSSDFEEAVGGTDFTDPWGVTAANNNTVFGLLNDFKVVCDDGSYFVFVFEEVRSVPEVVGSLGATVLSFKEGSLGNIAWRERK